MPGILAVSNALKECITYHSCVLANHMSILDWLLTPQLPACIMHRHVPDDFKGSCFREKSKQNVPLSRNPVNLVSKSSTSRISTPKILPSPGRNREGMVSHRRLTKSLFVTISRCFPPSVCVADEPYPKVYVGILPVISTAFADCWC